MSFLYGILASQWTLLGVKTLAITFVGRFILDAATSWTVNEHRTPVVTCVLIGWCAAVILACYIYAGGLGVIASMVACIWHVAELLRERDAMA